MAAETYGINMPRNPMPLDIPKILQIPYGRLAFLNALFLFVVLRSGGAQVCWSAGSLVRSPQPPPPPYLLTLYAQNLIRQLQPKWNGRVFPLWSTHPCGIVCKEGVPPPPPPPQKKKKMKRKRKFYTFLTVLIAVALSELPHLMRSVFRL